MQAKEHSADACKLHLLSCSHLLCNTQTQACTHILADVQTCLTGHWRACSCTEVQAEGWGEEFVYNFVTNEQELFFPNPQFADRIRKCFGQRMVSTHYSFQEILAALDNVQ